MTLYERMGGKDAVLRLARAWHRNCLADEVVAHAFSHGFHPQHDERIAAYWAEAWGGPDEFSRSISSETSLRRMHACDELHVEMDRRAIDCFARALDEAELPDDADLKRELLCYFAWGTGAMSAAGLSPEAARSLPVPIWS